MKFARIIDFVAVDVVEDDPVSRFHPDLAAEFVGVPAEVIAGSRMIDGQWIAPDPVAPAPAPADLGQMAIIDFLRLFTNAELAGFNAGILSAFAANAEEALAVVHLLHPVIDGYVNDFTLRISPSR